MIPRLSCRYFGAGNDLLTLINDILDLSKIEAGKLDVKPEIVGLARAVDELVDTFQPIARDKHLELTTVIEPGLPATIYTDPTRLQQIVKNLLSNALKFTERGGVALTVGRAPGGRIAFAVKDTGIGIPAEQHEVIFEAFRQADGTVESTAGRGSTFTLILPPTLPAQGGELVERPGSRPLHLAADRGRPRRLDRRRVGRERGDGVHRIHPAADLERFLALTVQSPFAVCDESHFTRRVRAAALPRPAPPR